MESTERDILAEVVREELEKITSGKENKETTNQPDPEFKLNLLGKEYTYKTKEEAEAALSATFQKAATELETLRSTQNAAPEKKEGAYVSGKESDAFSQDQYVELMGKGPKGILDATKYLLNHAIFEGKDPDAANTIKESLEEARRVKSTLAVYQFRELHPEFQLTNENTALVDNIRKELGQPFSLTGLEAAYGVAQSRGLVPSPQVAAYHKSLVDSGRLQEQTQNTQAQGATNSPFTNNSWQNAPPPTVNRQAGVQGGQDIAALAEGMSYEELDKYARSKGWI